MIYMFLSNNPSSGDINSSNLSFFFFESLDPSMMKPYRLVFITNVIKRRLRRACAFVQSRRVTQSFGVDEESRHLRTPTN